MSITRRSFIKKAFVGAAAIAAGVVVGKEAVAATEPSRIPDDAPSGSAYLLDQTHLCPGRFDVGYHPGVWTFVKCDANTGVITWHCDNDAFSEPVTHTIAEADRGRFREIKEMLEAQSLH